MDTRPSTITFVLGGARSGKSRYAQALAVKAGMHVTYLATAQACDDEMRGKIERHRQERPAGWRTVEVPLDLHEAIATYGTPDAFLLIDCLTTFTANLLMAEEGNESAIFKRIDCLRSALVSTPSSVAVVSNEAGSGIVPAYASGRQYRDLLGEINQIIAQISHNVVFMIAGCPLVLKGNGDLLA